MPFFDAAYAVSERPVRLLDVDPDLSSGLDAPVPRPLAELAVSTVRLRPGRWVPPAELREERLGLLVLEGVLVRTVRLGRHSRSELIGDTDLIGVGDSERALATVPFDVTWEVLQHARLGLLDEDFFAAAARWPDVSAALALRSVLRSNRLALQLAISDLRHIDDRLIALFLHLGDRWGRMTPEGIHVPLRLTHDLIAQLVGAQRPTVTTGLNALERVGRLERRSDRTWIVGASRIVPARASGP